MRAWIVQSRALRLALVVPAAVGLGFLTWWRGPEWNLVANAFTAVSWEWVVLAIALNLASVLARAVAWKTIIDQAMPAPRPRFPLVFSAFSVGLFANAVLPGRIGELARVAVLTRKMHGRSGAWAALIGTVFAHRVFDLIPSLLLIVYVLLTADIPHWAITSLVVVVGIGLALFAFAFASARHHQRSMLEEGGTLRGIVTMARHGLGVLHSPVPATAAALFQCIGWACQLFAVYTAMRAFDIHAPLPAAALVLVLMNLATLFPLWPGNNIGLLQAAIALPLAAGYGIAKARGVAFGFGLQFIEASVGVGVGLLFLAREGLSFAMLRHMPEASQAEVPDEQSEPPAAETDGPRARARIPG